MRLNSSKFHNLKAVQPVKQCLFSTKNNNNNNNNNKPTCVRRLLFSSLFFTFGFIDLKYKEQKSLGFNQMSFVLQPIH